MKVSALPSSATSRTSTTGIIAKAWWSDILERWLERLEKGSMELPFGEYAQQRADRQFIDLPLLDLPPFQVRDGPKYGFAKKKKNKATHGDVIHKVKKQEDQLRSRQA